MIADDFLRYMGAEREASPLTVKTYRDAIYDYLISNGIIVRNRSKITKCGNCLRITIGTRNENNTLLSALRALAERTSENK